MFKKINFDRQKSIELKSKTLVRKRQEKYREPKSIHTTRPTYFKNTSGLSKLESIDYTKVSVLPTKVFHNPITISFKKNKDPKSHPRELILSLDTEDLGNDAKNDNSSSRSQQGRSLPPISQTSKINLYQHAFDADSNRKQRTPLIQKYTHHIKESHP